MKGKVYLVGAGPGDPELLTVKALRLLGSADVVLHDDLVTPAILELASPAAQILNVGKRCGRRGFRQEDIHGLAISYANDGYKVVRLHGGDPLIFGRAAEEIAALRKAGVDFEIVPGVTSALGAAAAAQVSLTERRVASSVIFTTGHRCDQHSSFTRPVETAGGTELRPTVVVYMPTDYAAIANELQAAGWEGNTPCLMVSGAGTPEEASFLTRLSDLPEAPRLSSPKLLIIGATVKTASVKQTQKPRRLLEMPTPCRSFS